MGEILLWLLPYGIVSVAITCTGILLLAEFTDLVPGGKPSEMARRLADQPEREDEDE